jgi:hypothetical protein
VRASASHDACHPPLTARPESPKEPPEGRRARQAPAKRPAVGPTASGGPKTRPVEADRCWLWVRPVCWRRINRPGRTSRRSQGKCGSDRPDSTRRSRSAASCPSCRRAIVEVPFSRLGSGCRPEEKWMRRAGAGPRVGSARNHVKKGEAPSPFAGFILFSPPPAPGLVRQDAGA